MKVREAILLASEHYGRNQLAEAEQLYRQVLATSPDNFAALVGLGKIGIRTEHLNDAAELLGRAMANRSNDADARAAWAEALHRTGKRAQAEAIFNELLGAHASFFPAISRFGTALALAEHYSRAEPLLKRAAELHPSYQELFRYGSLLCHLGKLQEARVVLASAAVMCPGDAPAHMALGQAMMYAEDFPSGLREMEWRWKLPGPAYPNLPYPRWDGTIEPEKTLLLVGEEGFGDVIQFAGYLPELAAAGMKIILSARAELAELLRSLRGVRVIEDGTGSDPPPDAWLPLLSLPMARKMNIGSLARSTPYLFPDPTKSAAWKGRLADGFHVGLAWSGNPGHVQDARRSIPLSILAPLFDVSGITWHSLHVTSEAQQAIAATGLPVRDHTEHLHDFSDTAVLASNLDLVISIDSSMAHLAGALGKPTWILLYHPPDGRWMLRRTDTPFYPTARLFRQPHAGDWTSVIEAVRRELRSFVSSG